MSEQSANDPRQRYREQGFPPDAQDQPGLTRKTRPEPDHGERTYVGHGRLKGKAALITGGDSGIGRAVAIAFAREGADVALAYLEEEAEDAEASRAAIEASGRRALLLPGDLTREANNQRAVEQTVAELGGIDVLVLNAGYQRARTGIENLKTEEFIRVFETNLASTLWTTRAAAVHLKAGASIIVTSSIQAFHPSPRLLDYAMTKAALVAFTKALAQELTPKGIRVNSVAPGPIWTPLIPATSWPDNLSRFGQGQPLGRAGQPAEVAPAYVYLAGDAEASYTSGAVIGVTGGVPL